MSKEKYILVIADGSKEMEVALQYACSRSKKTNRKIIISEKNKKIIIKKTGIGNKIFQFAHNKPATYGILCIVFAVLAGLMGATIFRRL